MLHNWVTFSGNIKMLAPKVRAAIEAVQSEVMGTHTERFLDEIEICSICGTAKAHYEDFLGGYGYSIDGGPFYRIFDKNGKMLDFFSNEPECNCPTCKGQKFVQTDYPWDRGSGLVPCPTCTPVTDIKLKTET